MARIIRRPTCLGYREVTYFLRTGVFHGQKQKKTGSRHIHQGDECETDCTTYTALVL